MLLLIVMMVMVKGSAGLTAEAQPSTCSQKKTILWVDSYHAGFEWTDGIEKGIRTTLAGENVDLAILRMDTKRNKEESFKINSGKEAFAAVKKLRPDLVIASDDNAQRYFVLPYLRDTAIPVVFCGVNWDAAVYGYPWDNVTGMVEVEPIRTLAGHLEGFAKRGVVGYLSEETLTSNKIYAHYNKRFFDGALKKYLVKDFAQFKDVFLLAQKEVGMLILGSYAGIEHWDQEAARQFLFDNISIPIGASDSFMARYAVFTVSKVPEEQGIWAAGTALKILDNTPISSIPIVQNEQASLTVNLELAKALGITIPVATLRAAKVIGQETYQSR